MKVETVKPILLSLLALCYLIVSCQSSSDTRPDKQPPRLSIVCTTGIVADAIRHIVGDNAQVKALMGAGVDPHLYKATPADLRALREANVVFFNGLHLEGKMAEVLAQFGKQKPVFAIAEGIPNSRLHRVGERGDAYDPHVWFDVSLWAEAVWFASQKLQALDKKHAAQYAQNTRRYLDTLQKLHQEVRAMLATIPASRRVLITAHDAFGYFGKAYDIEVRGLQGISTVSEFGLREVSELVKFIGTRGIKALFVESSISPKSIEAVLAGCQSRGYAVRIGGTLYSDALAEPSSEAGNYVGMVRSNVKTILLGLK